MKITRTEVTIHSVEEMKELLSTLEAGALVFLEHLVDEEFPPDDDLSDFDPDLILNFDDILDA